MKPFRVGNWYESERDLRVPTHNPAKGIVEWKGQIYIIVTYHGSRRSPYADRLNIDKGVLSYVGHGRRGDQRRDHWNEILINAHRAQKSVRAFLDCGDIFQPKQLLYAGEWNVTRWYSAREDDRRVFRFVMRPGGEGTLQQLRDVVLYPKGNAEFEEAVRLFGKQRQRLYARFPTLLRAKDNLAGPVGEYFGVCAFNAQCGGRPLIRCSTSFRDIDAIQSGTSNGFAIKTTTGFPVRSSNIWSEEFAKAGSRRALTKVQKDGPGPVASINNFLIVVLDDCLQPRFIGHIPVSVAKEFSRWDHYQGSAKLEIGERMIRHRRMRVLYGDASALCE